MLNCSLHYIFILNLTVEISWNGFILAISTNEIKWFLVENIKQPFSQMNSLEVEHNIYHWWLHFVVHSILAEIRCSKFCETLRFAWYKMLHFDRRCFWTKTGNLFQLKNFMWYSAVTYRTYYIFRMNFQMVQRDEWPDIYSLFDCRTIADVLHFMFDSVQLNWMLNEGWRYWIRRTTKNMEFRFCIVVEMRVGHSVITHVACVVFYNTVGPKNFKY